MNKQAPNIWRFIDSGAAEGVFNMAADVVLAQVSSSSYPTLRVYSWQPRSISIGYHQSLDDLDFTRCQQDGIDIVRRPTGGGAIFHAHEVTYSVINPKSCLLYTNNSLDLYNQISLALVDGLQRIGLPVKLERQAEAKAEFSNNHQNFACFATSARYEIHCDSKKLVGSAQRKFDHAILQHGSIMLGNQHLKLLDYLTVNGNGAIREFREQLTKKTVCIETILKRRVSYKSVVHYLKQGFENHFNIEFVNQPLTQGELDKISLVKTNFTDLRRYTT